MSCLREGILLRGTFGSHDYRMTDPVPSLCPAGYWAYQSVRYCRKCGDEKIVWLGKAPDPTEGVT